MFLSLKFIKSVISIVAIFLFILAFCVLQVFISKMGYSIDTVSSISSTQLSQAGNASGTGEASMAILLKLTNLYEISANI